MELGDLGWPPLDEQDEVDQILRAGVLPTGPREGVGVHFLGELQRRGNGSTVAGAMPANERTSSPTSRSGCSTNTSPSPNIDVKPGVGLPDEDRLARKAGTASRCVRELVLRLPDAVAQIVAKVDIDRLLEALLDGVDHVAIGDGSDERDGEIDVLGRPARGRNLRSIANPPLSSHGGVGSWKSAPRSRSMTSFSCSVLNGTAQFGSSFLRRASSVLKAAAEPKVLAMTALCEFPD